MKLPVFDGVFEALQRQSLRRKRWLEREKTTPVKKRRIELNKRRALEGIERSEWTKKHGHHTYGENIAESGARGSGMKCAVERPRFVVLVDHLPTCVPPTRTALLKKNTDPLGIFGSLTQLLFQRHLALVVSAESHVSSIIAAMSEADYSVSDSNGVVADICHVVVAIRPTKGTVP